MMEKARGSRSLLIDMNSDPNVFIIVFYFGMVWIGVMHLCDLAIAKLWRKCKNRKARKDVNPAG